MDQNTKTRSQSRTDQIIEEITELILSGEIADGELLPPEPKLCEMFGVSRSILRESVRVVSAKGLLEVKQGRGTIARIPKNDIPEEAISNYLKTNPISLLQLMEVRSPIEIEIAKLAAQHREEKHLLAMAASFKVMQSDLKTAEDFAEADTVFHNALINATKNPLFGIIARSINHYLQISRQLTIRHFGVGLVIKGHTNIYEAVEKKDVEAAAKAMKSHMDITWENIRKISKTLEKDHNQKAINISI
jgi:DNA-binding FadR family transcriptional regulator